MEKLIIDFFILSTMTVFIASVLINLDYFSKKRKPILFKLSVVLPFSIAAICSVFLHEQSRLIAAILLKIEIEKYEYLDFKGFFFIETPITIIALYVSSLLLTCIFFLFRKKLLTCNLKGILIISLLPFYSSIMAWFLVTHFRRSGGSLFRVVEEMLSSIF